MRNFGETLKELFTASRFNGNTFTSILAWGHVSLSIILLFAPLFCSYFSLAKDDNHTITIISYILAAYGSIALLREVLDIHNDPIEKHKRDIIHNLLSQLNHMYNWKGKCRITLFTLDKNTINQQFTISPFDRTSGGAPPGIFGKKAAFKKGEGVPGIAWEKAWNGNDINQIIDCLEFGDVPEAILNDEEKLENFYKTEFNVDKGTFKRLGDGKSNITSYMSIGIQDQNMCLAALLVIDSTYPDFFHDFKELATVSVPTVIQRSGMSLSIHTETTDSPLELPVETQNIEKLLASLAKDVVNVPAGNQDTIPKKLKEINSLNAVHQIYDVSPANVAAALTPLEWTLKSLRSMRITK